MVFLQHKENYIKTISYAIFIKNTITGKKILVLYYKRPQKKRYMPHLENYTYKTKKYPKAIFTL